MKKCCTIINSYTYAYGVINSIEINLLISITLNALSELYRFRNIPLDTIQINMLLDAMKTTLVWFIVKPRLAVSFVQKNEYLTGNIQYHSFNIILRNFTKQIFYIKI